MFTFPLRHDDLRLGALDLYRASLAIDRAIGNAPGTATDLGNAGNAERRLGHADCGVYAEVIAGGAIGIGDAIVAEEQALQDRRN